MRKIREVLRLKALGHSKRQVSQSVGVSDATVRRYVERAERAGLEWPLPPDLTDAELERRLFPPAPPRGVRRPLPDWAEVQRELRRPGVTLMLLWLEYKADHPDGYQYSQYCLLYRQWREKLDVVLRQEHRAGEKLFVDYAGQTVSIVDRETGEIREAPLFVGTLGASNHTYVEATWTQSLPDWIGSHVRMLEYFGGVPAVLVPDNTRAGVKRACYYEPDLNPTYQEMAAHYGTTVLPARPYRPRDKAPVESGVQNAERWILAPLRNHTFFSLAEANREIARLREALADRPFQKLQGSRRSLFEEIDRPALRPLPPLRYEYAEWKKATVNIDYHIAVQGHFYSVPHRLVRERVEVRLTALGVEVFHKGVRVAAHLRSRQKGGYTTDPAHMPAAHRAHLEWSPARLIRWGEKTGPRTGTLIRTVLEARPHPEHGYRACLGILRLERRYGPQRLEAACGRALEIGGVSYRSVKSILEHGLDQAPLGEQITLNLPRTHEHLRGPDYYLH